MNEQRVNEIVEFWKARTGRAGPKTISLDMELGRDSGRFHLGVIKLSPIWADDETVFHELAHLEQFQDGRLSYSFEPIVPEYPQSAWEAMQSEYLCYQGMAVTMFEGKRANDLPYLERPAEIEARKRSKELLKLFTGKS